MRVLLVHVWRKSSREYRAKLSKLLSYPSLTLPSLVPLIPADADLTVVDEMTEAPNLAGDYDVVCLSADTSSVNQAYRYADHFRAHGAHVVMGGYHVSNLPDEALEHAQTVIIGAAEKSLPKFFDDYRSGRPERLYDDQTYLAEELTVPARHRQDQSKSLRVPTIIADRGCNLRCSFCAISEMWRSRPRPVGQVIDEIRSLRTDKLIFFDPNFFRPREYAVELMTELAKLKVQWGCNSTADTAFDDELLELAERSGCYGVLIGFESLSQASLKSVHKRFRQVDDFKAIVDRFHDHHIAVNGCWVVGFDHDTEESIAEMPQQIAEIGCDLVRYAVLTPLPGSRMFRNFVEDDRIIDWNWDHYDQRHAVYQPTNMSPERLTELSGQVWRDTYRMRRVIQRVRHSSSRTLTQRAYLLGANLGFKFLDL